MYRRRWGILGLVVQEEGISCNTFRGHIPRSVAWERRKLRSRRRHSKSNCLSSKFNIGSLSILDVLRLLLGLVVQKEGIGCSTCRGRIPRLVAREWRKLRSCGRQFRSNCVSSKFKVGPMSILDVLGLLLSFRTA